MTGRKATTRERHDYVSTACHHDLHDRCRKVCKFCDVPCGCRCHLSTPARETT